MFGRALPPEAVSGTTQHARSRASLLAISLMIADCDVIGASARSEAERCLPTVDAVYRYQRRLGIWLQYLSDLDPDHGEHAAPEGSRWDYDWAGYDHPPELRCRGSYHLLIFYQFPSTDSDPAAGWLAKCEGDRVSVDTTLLQVNTAICSDPSCVTPATVAELNRRIEREPDSAQHRKKLASVKLPGHP